MISRLALRATLPLLFSFAAFAAAQTLTPPPMKMGLWQADVTVQMSGMPNGVTMPPRTMTTQSCITPDTWKEALRGMQGRRPGMDCTNNNLQQDANHVTYDAQCTTQQGMNMTIHVDMHLDGDTLIHGTTSAVMSGGGAPSGMSMNSTITSKYVGADCGDIKPGQGKMLNGGPPAGGPPS